MSQNNCCDSQGQWENSRAVGMSVQISQAVILGGPLDLFGKTVSFIQIQIYYIYWSVVTLIWTKFTELLSSFKHCSLSKSLLLIGDIANYLTYCIRAGTTHLYNYNMLISMEYVKASQCLHPDSFVWLVSGRHYRVLISCFSEKSSGKTLEQMHYRL